MKRKNGQLGFNMMKSIIDTIRKVAVSTLRQVAILTATAACIIGFSGCENVVQEGGKTSKIHMILSVSNDYTVKSALPDEDLIFT